MIQIRGVSKSFGRIHALKDVSARFVSGKITGILGPNSCGKSTLIKSILGLVVPDQGTIEVFGEIVSKDHLYREQIGYMPQNPDFPSNLTVVEIFEMLEDIRGKKATRRDELTRLLEIEPHLRRSFGVLSGGTKQKVSMTAALMFAPRVLILDEPTVGLDPVAAARCKILIRDAAKQGDLVLLVTHIVSELQALVEDVVFLLEGQSRFHGSLTDLTDGSANLEDAIINLATSRVESRP